jgi:MFS family permease
MTAFGVGSVIGGLYGAGRKDVHWRQLSIFMFVFGLSMLGVSFAPSLNAAIIGMAVVGFFSIQVLSNANTMVQLSSAEDMRGRVMALWSVAMIGTTPIGGPIIGFVGEHFGARWGLAVGGIAAILTAFYAYSLLKSLTRMDRQAAQAASFSR